MWGIFEDNVEWLKLKDWSDEVGVFYHEGKGLLWIGNTSGLMGGCCLKIFEGTGIEDNEPHSESYYSGEHIIYTFPIFNRFGAVAVESLLY